MFLEMALQYRMEYLFLVLQCSVKAISEARIAYILLLRQHQRQEE
jgi:hypothetical protein